MEVVWLKTCSAGDMQARENSSSMMLSTGSKAPVPSGPASVVVVIAAWRAHRTIARAVASALAQPEAAEVVVVDDFSSDNGATVAAARGADDGSGRLLVIELKQNGGPSRARNAALSASRAPWICVLDSDDFMEAGRLATLLAAARDGHDFVADDLLQVPEGGDKSQRRALWFDGPSAGLDVSFEYFVRANIPHPDRPRRELGFLKPLMRREFLAKHGLRYREDMRLGEDYDLYARALALGARFRLIPSAGYISVMRGDSLSARHNRIDLAAFHASDDRLLALPQVAGSARKALKSHRLSVQKKISSIDFVDALKAGHLLTATGIMIRDPRQTAYLVRAITGILARKIAAQTASRAAIAETAPDAQPARKA